MGNTIIKIDPKEYGLEESKAADIAVQFKPMLDKMVELEAEYNEVIKLPISDPASAKKAKELRLKYVKVRTGTSDIHKQQKAFYLAGGRFIDGWKNAQLFASQGIEEKLEEIEKYAERMEAQRIADLQTKRADQLIHYEVANVDQLQLGSMSEDVWSAFFTGVVTKYDERKEAERKAEEDRKERERKDAEEREAQRKENARLKKEADDREAQIKNDREEADRKLAAERKKADDKLAAERKEAQKKIYEERKERDRLQKYLDYKRKDDERKEEERLAQIEAEAAKGEPEKMADLLIKLDEITKSYQFKSKKFKAIHASITELIGKTVAYGKSKCNTH